jgi:transposase
MDFIGFDLGKVASQVCIITQDGELIERRIKTDREHLAKLLGNRTPARILIESSTESEWVARFLEELNHEVIVADPNFASMYATRSRKVKTDKRDARTLAEACRLGAYRPAHRTSDEQRHVRAQLAVREAMVRTRSRYISLVSTLLRRDGLRIHNSGYTPTFLKRLAQLELPEALRAEIAPLVILLQSLNEQIKQADQQLAASAEGDEVLARLRTVPGVGVITATSFVSTLDDAARFDGAKQARAYLGLVPSERSSGERQRGHISKAGPGRARHMLVEAAWTILRRRSAANAALHDWAAKIMARRGSRVAVVALARKLAGILYAMWRDATSFTARTLKSDEVIASVAA